MLYTLRQIKGNLMGILEMGLGENMDASNVFDKIDGNKDGNTVKEEINKYLSENKELNKDISKIIETIKDNIKADPVSKENFIKEYNTQIEQSKAALEEKVSSIKEVKMASKNSREELSDTVGQTEQAEDFAIVLDDTKLSNMFDDVNILSFLESIVNGINISEVTNDIKKDSNDNDDYNSINMREVRAKIGYTIDGRFNGSEQDDLKKLLVLISEKPEMKTQLTEIYSDYYRKGLTVREYKNFKDFKGPFTIENIDKLRLLPKSNFTPDILIDMINKVSPEVQKKYLDNINNLGGGAGSFKIGEFYDEANRLLGTKTANETTYNEVFYDKGKTIVDRAGEIEKKYEAINEKVTSEIKKVEKQISESTTLTSEQKEKYLADLKNSTPLITGEIEKVGQGFFGNIGKGANIIGAGVTFEMFVKGLNLSLGVGTDGKTVLPGAVLSYTKGGKITDTISASAEIGASIVPLGVIPFVGASISHTNEIKILDAAGNATKDSISLKASPLGGTIMYSHGMDIAGGIDQIETQLNSTMLDIARATSGADIKTIIAEKITSSDSKINKEVMQKEQSRWLELIESTYKKDGLNDNSSFAKKLASLETIVTREIDKMNQNYANLTVDGSYFSGFGIGLGTIMGIPFPIGGISFTSREKSITDGGEANNYSRTVGTTLAGKSTTKTSKEWTSLSREDGISEEDMKLLTSFILQTGKKDNFILNSRDKDNFILNSRDKEEFGLFQKAKIDNNNDNTEALKHLEKYLKATKNSKESQIISGLLESNKNNKDKLNDLLGKINSLTSGSITTRGLGNSTDKANYLEKHKDKIIKELQGLKTSAIRKYEKMGMDTEITAAYSFDNYSKLVLNSPEKITTSFFGAVDYSQTLGKAKGLDGAAVGMPVIKASAGKTITVEAAKALLTENDSYKENIKGKLGISSDEKLYNLMAGQEITNDKGEKIKTEEVPKYYFGLAAVDGATCTNGVVYAEIPSLEVTKTKTVEGKPTTTTETIMLNDYNANRIIYSDDKTVIGASGYGKSEESKVKPIEEKTGMKEELIAGPKGVSGGGGTPTTQNGGGRK